MKIVKTASGKRTLKLSKREWQSLGKKAGWMKEAAIGDYTRDAHPGFDKFFAVIWDMDNMLTFLDKGTLSEEKATALVADIVQNIETALREFQTAKSNAEVSDTGVRADHYEHTAAGLAKILNVAKNTPSPAEALKDMLGAGLENILQDALNN